MENLKNPSPGDILLEEFLKPLDISQYRLAKELDVPQTRISEIIKGNRKITADTAIRFSAFFGNSAKFWLGLQNDFDIENELSLNNMAMEKIHRYNDKEMKEIL
jgi:addiction module HigA family antidote